MGIAIASSLPISCEIIDGKILRKEKSGIIKDEDAIIRGTG